MDFSTEFGLFIGVGEGTVKLVIATFAYVTHI